MVISVNWAWHLLCARPSSECSTGSSSVNILSAAWGHTFYMGANPRCREMKTLAHAHGADRGQAILPPCFPQNLRWALGQILCIRAPTTLQA